MNPIHIIAASSGALLATAAPPAFAQHTDPALSTPREVVIQSRAGGPVRHYVAYQPDVVYLQDCRDLWYRAQLSGPCFDTAYHRGIAFRNRGGAEAVDRFSTIVRDDGRTCGLTSLVRGKPPKGGRSIAGN